tara:strand:+ start:13061 stop:13738 length:678 start_codon:yes stop_codon:yes gene_type:complete
MRKLIIIVVFVSFSLSNMQCSKKETNQPPSVVALIYPSENLLCIDNTIGFNWGAAIDPENDKIEYNIIVAKDRALTSIVENRTISNRQVTIELEKETAYYWKVDALDVINNQGSESEIYAFYTKGESVSNYVPFTAALLTPENESQVDAGSLSLTWDAGDANIEDILTYEVFFGENDTLALMDDAIPTKSYTIAVESGKTYSWRVDVKDQNGAKSIGQIWSFTVN